MHLSSFADLLISQLWIKGMLTPQETREKAKEDSMFCERLLNYISQVVEECMPEDLDPHEEDEDESRLFEQYTHPNGPNFKRAMGKTLQRRSIFSDPQTYSHADLL
jgi:hypothetical protein